ncbi:hypothetical protein F442_15565 [Phytophthora nicotianae P10297]|uniref:Uncharacterized protein n=2 Tax=Phytophthora nicotianae TaxID=4792 RepID=W2YNX1_PHYNI|nr:hypothetical protein F444_15708 [Phytophthora nicotianae P1976]ETP36527.1 hypothetical protein F442_15565 [Phytophthora nicotianae P10297]
MSWQQNAVKQRTFGTPRCLEERDSGSPSGDSRILRYIKTLTSHQTNAKQQRMDQYLQKVKHTHPTEDVKGLKPLRYSTTTNERQNASAPTFRAPVTSMWKEAIPREQQKLLESNKSSYRRPKRSCDGDQGNRQMKKAKRASTKQQVAAVDALDRFRLKSTPLQIKSQTRVEISGSKISQHTTLPADAQHIKLQVAATQPQMPLKSKLGNVNVNNREVTRPVQVCPYTPSPAKESIARPVAPPARDEWANSNQHASFLPTETQTLDSEQEDFVTTFHHLSAIMESIYF